MIETYRYGRNQKIICPSCRAILTVGYFEGIEAKSFPCPKCHNVHKYTDCPPYMPQAQNTDETDLGNVVHQQGFRKQASDQQTNGQDDRTQPCDMRGTLIGHIQVQGYGSPVQLKKGRNVIGREASSSKADIRFPDDTATMSREHFYIDVLIQEGKVIHILSVCPTAKNQTLLDDSVIGPADRMVLHDGSRIKAGKVCLIFNIPQ